MGTGTRVERARYFVTIKGERLICFGRGEQEAAGVGVRKKYGKYAVLRGCWSHVDEDNSVVFDGSVFAPDHLDILAVIDEDVKINIIRTRFPVGRENG